MRDIQADVKECFDENSFDKLIHNNSKKLLYQYLIITTFIASSLIVIARVNHLSYPIAFWVGGFSLFVLSIAMLIIFIRRTFIHEKKIEKKFLKNNPGFTDFKSYRLNKVLIEMINKKILSNSKNDINILESIILLFDETRKTRNLKYINRAVVVAICLFLSSPFWIHVAKFIIIFFGKSILISIALIILIGVFGYAIITLSNDFSNIKRKTSQSIVNDLEEIKCNLLIQYSKEEEEQPLRKLGRFLTGLFSSITNSISIK